MRKTVRYTLRFLVIVAVVASLSAFYAPSTNQHSPYRSALSALSVTPALAGGCNTKCGSNHTCVDSGGVQEVCQLGVTCRNIQC